MIIKSRGLNSLPPGMNGETVSGPNEPIAKYRLGGLQKVRIYEGGEGFNYAPIDERDAYIQGAGAHLPQFGKSSDCFRVSERRYF